MQEYERAVIFRLGRLMSGGAKGPGKKTLMCNGKLLISYGVPKLYGEDSAREATAFHYCLSLFDKIYIINSFGFNCALI